MGCRQAVLVRTGEAGSEYYRWKYPVFGTYSGGVLVEAFRAAASERAGARWPRHTPPSLMSTD
ncbi:hypothetical protein ABZ826_15540 [Streptomyces sp. NPDC047515]|uniref:hypothetical protein n=1 Tax=Streptomyces sp. NPDC047515 TaxID=3155380 RepID=UPI00340D0A59